MSRVVISRILAVTFVVISLLNLILVHPVPGAFYLLLSWLYVPYSDVILKQRFGFTLPWSAKLILAFLILWGTLAVGDLAEILGL